MKNQFAIFEAHFIFTWGAGQIYSDYQKHIFVLKKNSNIRHVSKCKTPALRDLITDSKSNQFHKSHTFRLTNAAAFVCPGPPIGTRPLDGSDLKRFNCVKTLARVRFYDFHIIVRARGGVFIACPLGRPAAILPQQHHYFTMFYMIAVNMWILFPFVECAPADRNPDCEMRSCIRVAVWLRARVIVCGVSVGCVLTTASPALIWGL